MSSPRLHQNLRRVLLTLVVLIDCWLPAYGAAPNSIPVVSRLAGSATITTSSGTSHELSSVEPLQSDSTLTTALDSLVAVHLEQVGQVQLGPQTKASVSVRNGWLSVQLTSGSLCVDSQSQNVSVNLGSLRLAVSSPSTIYDVLLDGSATTIAVFRGGIVIGGSHMSTKTIYAGGAATGPSNGALSDVAIASVVSGFAKLKCPEANVISDVLPPTPPPDASGRGHGGAIIGTLLGLAAIAAAVGHSGGGGNATVALGPPGPITLSRSSVNLRVGAPSSPISVSESNYNGVFTAAASVCAGIATITPASGTSFSVSPVAAGNCRITFSDDHGQSAPLLAFVIAGTMLISPQTLQLSTVGNSNNFIVSDSSPTTFSAISSNLAVATVTLIASTATAATFKVAAILNGKATIAVADTLGGAGNVSVGVGQAPLAATRHASFTPEPQVPFAHTSTLQLPEPRTSAIAPTGGKLLTSTLRLVFPSIGISQVLRVTEKGYNGTISATSSDPNVAAVGQVLGAGDVTTIVVISRSFGRALIHITDDHGSQVTVGLIVLPEPSRSVRDSSRP